MTLQKIISGGQTGSDRGGLNAAIKIGIPHGGTCPQDRRAEDGVIPLKYKLKQTNSSEYPPRTTINVLDSDGTIVFTVGKPERGSALTLSLCNKHKKPSLHIDLGIMTHPPAAQLIAQWITREKINVLNVAGNRESVFPGIEKQVEEVLIHALTLGGHVPFGPRNVPERKTDGGKDQDHRGKG